MIKNWKVTAWLSSPLAGEPPMFDSILGWELSRRLGYKHAFKLTRDIPLSEIKKPANTIGKKNYKRKGCLLLFRSNSTNSAR